MPIDGPAAAEVQGLRRALGDGSLGRIAPHLTLVAPCNVRGGDLPAALGRLRAAATALSGPLELVLGPVATFAPANPVLYLEVGGDLDRLGALRQQADGPPLHRDSGWPWVPHVTVANDIAPAAIPYALAALDSFRLAVRAERAALLELEEGKWRPVADALFASPSRIGQGGLVLDLVASRSIDPEAGALVAGAGGAVGEAARLLGASHRPPVVVTARRGLEVCGLAAAWIADDGGHLVVVVAPQQRRQGIGRHLLMAAESATAAAGWETGRMVMHGPPAFYAALGARPPANS